MRIAPLDFGLSWTKLWQVRQGLTGGSEGLILRIDQGAKIGLKLTRNVFAMSNRGEQRTEIGSSVGQRFSSASLPHAENKDPPTRLGDSKKCGVIHSVLNLIAKSP